MFGRRPTSRRETRSSAVDAPARISYNENLEHVDRLADVRPSEFPCYDFMMATGIANQFNDFVARAGLTKFLASEEKQYLILTNLFVQSFIFNDDRYEPTVEFYIYHEPRRMPLHEFCRAIHVPEGGLTTKLPEEPQDLKAFYREICYGDTRDTKRGKIPSIQFPAVRYFAYFIARCLMGKENSINTTNSDIWFLQATIKGIRHYDFGALVARRLVNNKKRGAVNGGIIASRVASYLRKATSEDDVEL